MNRRTLTAVLMLCLLCGCSNTPPVQAGQTETVTQTVQETQETASAEQPPQTDAKDKVSGVDHSEALVMSAESGFYDAPFDLEITAPAGCTIYYTTDGSIPDSTKTEYKKPITLLNRSVTDNYLSAVKG
ncbi:MAG: chitobiase/beta-hexosaminidase C-terminal domain-containing protein, partial [Oscillospiraceae bacterium]|nr:chitobiase/beta-hexosaminidase C-terminal domain-containing protein [Oscillospiraceae bacterium]